MLIFAPGIGHAPKTQGPTFPIIHLDGVVHQTLPVG